MGRVINISTEDAHLREDGVGLFNVGDETSASKFRVQLNTAEVPSYSLFEGEVVVAEGFNDLNSRFNVNRIHKPATRPPKALHPVGELKRFADMQNQRSMQVMVACGPYTARNGLNYEGLQDLMARVRQDKP